MSGSGSVALASMASAVGLVAAAGPGLEATDVVVEVALDDGSSRGGISVTSFLRVQISAPDEEAARDLADVLQLEPADEGHGWSGTYPLTEVADRPLCVDVALTAAACPRITLWEAFGFLDLLGGVLQTAVQVVRVHLHAHGSAEIHTADPRGAQTLRLELAGIQFPLQPAVIAPPTDPHPAVDKDSP